MRSQRRTFWTLAISVFLFWGIEGNAQVSLSLRYASSDGRYHVFLTPQSNPLGANATLTDGSSQITITSSTGGNLVPTNIQTAGTATVWSLITTTRNTGDLASGAPMNTDFFVFAPGGNFNLNYQTNVEVELFSFAVAGGCSGSLAFLAGGTQTAAGGTLNIGSYYSVLGLPGGIGVNHFNQTYAMDAPCNPVPPVVCQAQAQTLSKNP